jgi:hypothetical protein
MCLAQESGSGRLHLLSPDLECEASWVLQYTIPFDKPVYKYVRSSGIQIFLNWLPVQVLAEGTTGIVRVLLPRGLNSTQQKSLGPGSQHKAGQSNKALHVPAGTVRLHFRVKHRHPATFLVVFSDIKPSKHLCISAYPRVQHIISNAEAVVSTAAGHHFPGPGSPPYR